MNTLHVGVIGYSQQEFDADRARKIIRSNLRTVESQYPEKQIVLVSGYTDIGIPKIAYDEAEKLGWKTMGIACSKCRNYETRDVDTSIIVGTEWGDESSTFLDKIDMLIKIGGGEQSEEEKQTAIKRNIPVFSYRL